MLSPETINAIKLNLIVSNVATPALHFKLKEEIKVLKEKIEVQNRVVYEYMNQFGITDYIEKAGDNWHGPMEEEDFAAVKAKLCNATKQNGGKRNTKRKKKK